MPAAAKALAGEGEARLRDLLADFVRRSPLRRAKAEREGFKPPVPCSTPDFESGTFDHSDTSPYKI